MYKYIVSLVLLTLISELTLADVSVRGYHRKDGTYVRPHMRSNPDGNFNNNWSTIGNINPYTGKLGTKTQPSYQSNGSYQYSNDYSSESKNYNRPLTEPVPKGSYSTGYTNTIRNYNSSTVNTDIQKVNSNWVFFYKNTEDAMYINNSKREFYGDGLPVVSMMFTGVMKPNGKPTWLGKRFIKVKVNCLNKKVALIADAVVNSNGKVTKSIVRRENYKFTWVPINKITNQARFLATTKVCI
jgi:hypothetical protein